MDESKRHVTEDYPGSKLPEELRGTIDPTHRTRVIVEELASDLQGRKPAALRFFGAAASRETSVDEAVSRIRALRDEWDS